jgi:hypothetical protein
MSEIFSSAASSLNIKPESVIQETLMFSMSEKTNHDSLRHSVQNLNNE